MPMLALADETAEDLRAEYVANEGSVQDWIERRKFDLSAMTLDDLAFELRVEMMDAEVRERFEESDAEMECPF